jgi:hypothetical protein
MRRRASDSIDITAPLGASWFGGAPHVASQTVPAKGTNGFGRPLSETMLETRPIRAALPIILGAAAGLLAACDRGDLYSKQSPAAPLAVTSAMAGTPPFVGRWAATRADCPAAAWTFTPTGLQAPNGTHCAFVKESVGSAGYGMDVSCTGAGPGQIGRVTLTLSGQGATHGLTVAGGPFPMPVALTPCPAT